MTNLNSLFLSQAYNDCWDDYNRSLKLRSFPRWDYVILTASNEQQAEGFRKAFVGKDCYLEVSYVHGNSRIGSHSVLSYIDVQDQVIPDNVVLHGLKQRSV